MAPGPPPPQMPVPVSSMSKYPNSDLLALSKRIKQEDIDHSVDGHAPSRGLTIKVLWQRLDNILHLLQLLPSFGDRREKWGLFGGSHPDEWASFDHHATYVYEDLPPRTSPLIPWCPCASSSVPPVPQIHTPHAHFSLPSSPGHKGNMGSSVLPNLEHFAVSMAVHPSESEVLVYMQPPALHILKLSISALSSNTTTSGNTNGSGVRIRTVYGTWCNYDLSRCCHERGCRWGWRIPQVMLLADDTAEGERKQQVLQSQSECRRINEDSGSGGAGTGVLTSVSPLPPPGMAAGQSPGPGSSAGELHLGEMDRCWRATTLGTDTHSQNPMSESSSDTDLEEEVSGLSASASPSLSASMSSRLSPPLLAPTPPPPATLSSDSTVTTASQLASVTTPSSEESFEYVINIKNCPLCHRLRLDSKAEVNIITHITVCPVKIGILLTGSLMSTAPI
ncbi:hypothetical protein K438DRAFT_1977483 [Mycena galopus ATCC 62051]|nr:hypothetical protein K438DRAFT_1977483 [Mycena galopus ATCC 62051]